MIPDPRPSDIALPLEKNPVRDDSLAVTEFTSTSALEIEQEGVEFEDAKIELPVVDTNAALITIEDARVKLADDILKTLQERFNGKLTEVRRVDAKDRIF